MTRGTSKVWRVRDLSLLGALATLLALAVISSAAGKGDAHPLLRLHRGTFDAQASASPSALADLADTAPSLTIIQFDAPIATADRAALQATGVTILEYIPDYAYLVRGDPAQLAAAAQLPGVYARAPLLDADKLAPALLRALAKNSLKQPLRLTLRSWPGQEQALAADLNALGIDARQPLDAARLRQVIHLASVRWAEPATEYRLLNDEARKIIGVPAVWDNHGLFGKGQIVAIADSGLDTGDPATISPDFAGRIIATHVLSAGGDLADNFGHGTHAAGSITGAGVLSGAHPELHQYEGSFAGVAPEASLVVEAFEVDSSGAIQGLGDDPYPIFATAYADSARIHSDSWGGFTGTPFLDPFGMLGGYPLTSQRTDQFIWEHPDMSIFFAAGNSGNDGLYFIFACLPLADGVIDPDSLNAPGTAKNVITVGASESQRADAPRSGAVWRDVSASCYSADPVASDTVSDNPDGMAAFSSRGPADDGRMKPDLVAPGTNILSTRTHMDGANDLWGVYASNPNYIFSGGTSMAAPIAAGAGVLVREWLTGQGLANPSAAVVKATLLNTTHDMAPGQYGAGAKQEIPFARPNGVTGWGRVDLGFIDAPSTYKLWADDHTGGLATGQSVSYSNSASQPLVVTSSDVPLRVMLAWTDPPASLTAAKQLVNDLDLLVTAPDGHQYWGNATVNGDRTNNVEGVIIASPLPGAYMIEVRAHNIPIGAQPYALSVGAALTSIAPPTPTATPSSTPAATPAPSRTPSPTPVATPAGLPDTKLRLFMPLIMR